MLLLAGLPKRVVDQLVSKYVQKNLRTDSLDYFQQFCLVTEYQPLKDDRRSLYFETD